MPKATIKGRKLHFLDVGKGYPILFGHSFLWDCHMWKPQIDHLSQHFRCIVPDLWSHGQSDDVPSKEPYSVPEMAEDHYELMKFLKIDTFSVIGLSVGGMIGVDMALKYPEAVDGLGILSSFVGQEPFVAQEKYFALMDQIDRNKRFTSEIADIITPLFFSPSTLKSDPDLVRSFNIHLRSIPGERVRGITNIGRGIFTRPDRLNQLERIKIPTLVMVGEDDAPRPPKEASQMAELLPNASLVILSQAGHICNLEQPEDVTGEIEKFIRRIALEKEEMKMVG